MRAVALSDSTLVELIDVEVVELDIMGADEVSGETLEQLRARLEGLGDAIADTCTSVKGRLTALGTAVQPDAVEVEFGVSVTGKMRYVFVGAEGRTTFKVKLRWGSGEIEGSGQQPVEG
jgi:hypothetical protein